MKKVILSILALAGVLGAQTAPAVFIGAPLTATVSANLASTSYTIPSNFVGWSVENQDLIGGYYAPSQTSFLGLAGLLGKNGIIRIGGITSDTATLPLLTQQIATDYATFITTLGTGWSTIYGLDACDNSAAHALSQATFLINALGVGNIVFQVGNEPPFETCGFSQGTWTTTFNAYVTAVQGAFGTAKFAGPDVTNNSTVQSFVNGTAAGLAGTTYVTTHYYPYGIGFSPVADQVISVVAANDTVSSVNSFAFQSNTAYAPGKLMMTEGSDRAGCGLLGVTDRLMTSAWYLNMAITLANDLWIGFQPHNAIMTCFGQAHNGYYDPFVLQSNGTFTPSPMFYGMYLFSQIEGQVTVATTITGTANVKAISTKNPFTGKANILIQNNSTTFASVVTPTQSTAFTTAKVLLLKGSACDDAAPTLGGAAIGAGGAWTGTTSTILSGGTVTIGPCGAALVAIQ